MDRGGGSTGGDGENGRGGSADAGTFITTHGARSAGILALVRRSGETSG
jgi:hypothetical protein